MAVYANLIVDQGSSFISTVGVEDSTGGEFNLTGYTARAQLRRTYKSRSKYDFEASISSPSTGDIELKMPAVTTGALTAGRYVYDVEIVSPEGEVTRVVEGQLEVMPRVTTPIAAEIAESLLVFGDLGPLTTNQLDAFGVPIGNYEGFADLMDPAKNLIANDLGTI